MDGTMNFGQRLKSMRMERNLTQQQLADNINVSVVTIRNWESNKKKPTMDCLISIGMALRCSIDTVIGFSVSGEQKHGLMLIKPEKSLLEKYRSLDTHGRRAVDAICAIEVERMKSSAMTIYKLEKRKPKKTIDRFIPHYSTTAAAGIAVPLDDVDFEMIPIDELTPNNADYAVDIQGNSMSPYIKDGETVFVERTERISIGDVGIFCVDGAMYCKQYYTDKAGNLVLVSANAALRKSNVFVSSESCSDVKCYGKVILKERIPLPFYLEK